MKKLTFLFSLLLFVACTRLMAWTGAGTLADPYQISTAAELATLATNVNAGTTYSGTYFKLINDISLSGYPDWTPIGRTSYLFYGVFDGNNKIITGLTLTNSNKSNRGLFGIIGADCEIKDLTIEGCSVVGWSVTGALVGSVDLNVAGKAIKITNCKSSGTVVCSYFTGGLIGAVTHSKGTGGDIYTVLITNCSSSAAVTCSAASPSGGLIGYLNGNDSNSTPIISNSYATGSVTANNGIVHSGGLIGQILRSKIVNCYARGNVSATGTGAYAGGFAGNVYISSITNCYSTGAVTGTAANVLGFIGTYVPGTITSSYWDKETSGKTTSGGGEVGKTTAEMKTQSTFTGWDFSTTPVWKIAAGNNDGYPELVDPSDIPATVPTTQANTIAFTNVTASTMTIGWANGDGAKRAVFVKQDNTGTASPVDNTTYTANTAFGNSGSQIGTTEWYCVYNGTSNSVDITGLTPSTNYIAQVFEYNGSSGGEKYLTTTATDNPKVQETIALIAPTNQATSLLFSAVASSSLTTSWTNGNGSNRAVFVKQASSGTASPTDNTTYTANTTFGSSGSQIGATGWYCVYNGTGTSVNISGLTLSTGYVVHVCEYNGSAGTEKYLTTSGSNNPASQTTNSSANYALQFDGVDDYVNIGNAFNPKNNTTFTYEAWIYPTAYSVDNTIFGFGNGTSDGKVMDFRLVNGRLNLGTTNNNSWLQFTGSSTLTLNVWTHVAVVSVAGTITMYVNGISDGSGSIATSSYADASVVTLGNLYFNGAMNNAFAFQGYMDDVRIWNTNRTLTQIKQSAGIELAGSESNLAAYYKFNEGTGSTTQDNITASTHDGTVSGAAWTGSGSVICAPLNTPVSGASAIVFSGITQTGTTISWTNGNGVKRAVFVKQTEAGTATPDNNTTYTANTVFGNSGSQIGSTGWYCVYNGTGTTVSITGLTSSTNYIAHVVEYNGLIGGEQYQAGTFTNNPKVQQTTALDYAILFDGTNDYVLLPNTLYTNSLAGGTEITIEYRFKGTVMQSAVRFQDNSNFIVAGWNDGINNRRFILSNDKSTSGPIIGTNPSIEDNNWHHIAMTWKSSGNFYTYLDGVQSAPTAANSSTLPTITGGYLGAYGNTQERMAGTLDEVRIWNVARTAAQIVGYKDVQLKGNEPGLVAYYKMSNGSGTTLTDNKTTGTAYNGTLTNGPLWASGANVAPYYNVWNNSSGTNWGTAANWLSGTLPDATDNVTIKNASAKPIVNESSSSPAVCKNLTIEAGGVLTIAAGKALTVNGNLSSSADSTGLVIKSDINGTGSLKIIGSVSAPASVQRFASLNRWYLVSSPIGTQTIKDFIAKNTDIPVLSNDANTYGIRSYSTGDLSEWSSYFTNGYLTTNSAREMGVGKGYLIRTYTDGTPKTLNFQGNLNSQGNMDVTLTKSGTNGWNLIGNPYTSAIKIHDGTSEIEATPDNFINANDAKFDDVAYGVYFWNDASIPKKFDVINNINKPITYAQVGQGFFVKAKTAGSSTVSFTTDMQYHMGDEALKSTVAPNLKIELVASIGSQSASTDILFVQGATKGLDRGYDAGILKADPSFALYTKLVEPFDAEFQLQCLPINQYNNLVIPIGLDSKSASEIVFTVKTVQLAQDCKVILEDKLTHTFTDLSKGSYKATVLANTAGTGRFFLYTGDIVSGLEDHVLPGKVTAYAKGNKEIRVIGEVGEGAVATLFNGLGQVVLTKKLDAGNINIIGLPNLKSGLYLLNINDNGTPQTIKVMVRK